MLRDEEPELSTLEVMDDDTEEETRESAVGDEDAILMASLNPEDPNERRKVMNTLLRSLLADTSGE